MPEKVRANPNCGGETSSSTERGTAEGGRKRRPRRARPPERSTGGKKRKKQKVPDRPVRPPGRGEARGATNSGKPEDRPPKIRTVQIREVRSLARGKTGGRKKGAYDWGDLADPQNDGDKKKDSVFREEGLPGGGEGAEEQESEVDPLLQEIRARREEKGKAPRIDKGERTSTSTRIF